MYEDEDGALKGIEDGLMDDIHSSTGRAYRAIDHADAARIIAMHIAERRIPEQYRRGISQRALDAWERSAYTPNRQIPVSSSPYPALAPTAIGATVTFIYTPTELSRWCKFSTDQKTSESWGLVAFQFGSDRLLETSGLGAPLNTIASMSQFSPAAIRERTNFVGRKLLDPGVALTMIFVNLTDNRAATNSTLAAGNVGGYLIGALELNALKRC